MIHVKKATLLTYGGREVEVIIDSLFREPLWKIREIILDKTIKLRKQDDPFVKVVRLDYSEYGNTN